LGEKTIAGRTTVQAVTAGEKALYKMEGKALAHLTKTCTGVACVLMVLLIIVHPGL
jgi:hypothetical protein